MDSEALKVMDLIGILEKMPQDATVELEIPEVASGGDRWGVTKVIETWYNSPKQKVVVLCYK